MANKPNMGYSSTQANEMLMGLPGAMAAMGKKAYMGLGNLLEKKIIEASIRPKFGIDEKFPGELSGLKPVSTEGSNTFLPFVNTDQGYEARLPSIAGDAYNAFTASRRSMTDPNFNAEEEGVNMGLNLMGGGTAFGKIPAGSIGMLAGRRAKFANLSKLDKAKSMAQQGIDRSQILKETQWFKAPDGEWKFEIDDSLAKAADNPNWSRHEIVDQTNLGDVLIHDNLYNSYEEIPKYIMTKEKSPAANIAGGYASWHGADRGMRMTSSGFGPTQSTLDAIAVLEKTPEYKAYSDASFNLSYPNYNEAKLKFDLSDVGKQWNRLIMERDKLGDFGKSATLHELMHGIQEREGFAKGGNPKEFLKYKEGNHDNFRLKHENEKYAKALKSLINDHIAMGGSASTAMKSEQGKILSDSLMKMQDAMKIDKEQALDLYNRQAGEVEARAVQTRMNMTPEQREARPFWLDYDVPEADQIIRFGDSGKVGMTAQDVLAQESKGLVPPKYYGNNDNTYYRRSKSESGSNDVPWQMFAKNKDDIDNAYSGNLFLADNRVGKVVNSDSIIDAINDALSKNYEILDTYQANASDLAQEASPSRIVDSAGLWDSPDITQYIYDEVLAPLGIQAVETPDGLIVFDPDLVKMAEKQKPAKKNIVPPVKKQGK